MMYGRRPLTKLESGLYAAIVAILLAVFARQALDYMEIAERATMQATLSNAASAINFRLGYNILMGGSPRDADWATRNPFEIARMSPPNFAGEVESSQIVSLGSGSWAFDTATAELVYLPRLSARLETANKDGVLRFRLERQTGAVGYVLVPTTPYRWE